MEIKTKFNHGQRVQAIISGQDTYKEKCPVCEGKGGYEVNGHTLTCSSSPCYGSGYVIKAKEEQWFVPKDSYYNFVIQKIGVELYNPNNKTVSNNRSWIYYMSGSSGTMFDENNLFSSVEEAQKECDIRNNKTQ